VKTVVAQPPTPTWVAPRLQWLTPREAVATPASEARPSHHRRTVIRFSGLGLVALTGMFLLPATTLTPSIPASVISRLTYDVGMFALIGIVVVVGWAYSRPLEDAQQWIVNAWGMYLIGTITQIEVGRETSHMTMWQVLQRQPQGTGLLATCSLTIIAGAFVLGALPKTYANPWALRVCGFSDTCFGQQWYVSQ
jgi:hypothetical protein